MRALLVMLLVGGAGLASGAFAPQAPTPSVAAPATHYQVVIVDASTGITTVPIRDPSDFLGQKIDPADGWSVVSVRDANGALESIRSPSHPLRVYVGQDADVAREMEEYAATH